MFLGFLVIAYSSNSEQITEEDLRNCNISNEYLDKGVVKKFLIKNGDKEFIFYDKVFKESGFIISERYTESYHLLRKDRFEINKDCWKLIERIKYGNNYSKVSVVIDKPLIISFNPEIKENTAEFTVKIDNRNSYKKIEKMIQVEKTLVDYKNEKIECIKYKNIIVNSVTDLELDKVVHDSKSEGFSLFGKDIGWFHMTIYEKGEAVSYDLIKIMTIADFNKKL